MLVDEHGNDMGLKNEVLTLRWLSHHSHQSTQLTKTANRFGVRQSAGTKISGQVSSMCPVWDTADLFQV